MTNEMNTQTTAMDQPKCRHCGTYPPHDGQCPLIKAIDYHQNGNIKRVEYHDIHGDNPAAIGFIKII